MTSIQGNGFNQNISQGTGQGKRPVSPYKDKLEALGLKPTGSAQGDYEAIQKAEQGLLGSDKTEGQGKKGKGKGIGKGQGKGPRPVSPYKDELDALGLKPTGSAQGDWDAIQEAKKNNGTLDDEGASEFGLLTGSSPKVGGLNFKA